MNDTFTSTSAIFLVVSLAVVTLCDNPAACEEPSEQLEFAKLSGSVVDEGGNGVAMAKVWLGDGDRRFPRFVSTRADGQGRFRFDNVTPGAVSLVAMKPGYSFGGQQRDVQSGQIENNMDVVLMRPQRLSLRVEDVDGRAVAGAELAGLRWKSRSGDFHELPLELLTRENVPVPRSDADGRLIFDGVPGDSVCFLRVKHREFVWTTASDVKPGEQNIARVTLDHGVPITVETMRSGSDEPARGSAVTVISGSDRIALDEPVDEDGQFRIHLPAAKNSQDMISVLVAHPELISLEADKSWVADQTHSQTLRFELARRGRLRGRVINDQGKGLPAVRVGVFADNRYVKTGFSGDDGRYETDAPVGTLTLKVLSVLGYEGVNDKSVSVVVTPDQVVEVPELHAKPLPTLRGVVVLPDGQPAGHALVVIRHSTYEGEMALADERGRFELPLRSMPLKFAHVIARHMTKRFSGGATIEIPQIVQGDELRVELQPETTIQGRLTGRDESPKGRVQITLQAKVQCDDRIEVYNSTTATTNELGEFRFPGLSRHLSYRVDYKESKRYLAPVKAKIAGAATDFVAPQQKYVTLNLRTDPQDILTAATQIATGRNAPKLSCQAWINSKSISLASLRGKVVLIDFWATWCGPCVKEIPNVQLAHESFAQKGLVIIGVHPNSASKADVLRFIESRNVTYPIGLDDEAGNTVDSYGIKAWPTKILIDRSGRVISGDLAGNLLAALRNEVLYGSLEQQD